MKKTLAWMACSGAVMSIAGCQCVVQPSAPPVMAYVPNYYADYAVICPQGS